MFRRSIQEYFKFSKKELNGILILCLLLFLLLILPFIYEPHFFTRSIDIDEFKKEAAAFEASLKQKKPYSYREIPIASDLTDPKAVYFNFDPNLLPESDWRKLGLSEKQIRVIKNYEAKGGRFYRKEDVQKMYVISKEKYRELEPYIQIKATKFENRKEKPGAQFAVTKFMQIDLNTADSLSLQQIKGIGPAFASRIVRYRDRLGGFYALTQLKEVYGVDSLKYAQWLPQLTLSKNLKLISINSADFESLKKHPYLNYKQINALIQYRKQHGPFDNLQSLGKVGIISEENLRKIAPYLNFE
jgi:competence protein ComEA